LHYFNRPVVLGLFEERFGLEIESLNTSMVNLQGFVAGLNRLFILLLLQRNDRQIGQVDKLKLAKRHDSIAILSGLIVFLAKVSTEVLSNEAGLNALVDFLGFVELVSFE
jgi:hypothetical protein